MYQTLVQHMGQNKKSKTAPEIQNCPTETSVTAIATTSTNSTASYTMTMNNNNIQTLKTENFDLLELTNTDDDEMLSNYLDQNDKILRQHFTDCANQNLNNSNAVLEAKSVTNVQNIQNLQTVRPNMPIFPKMYFPNSNVTINYNFGK